MDDGNGDDEQQTLDRPLFTMKTTNEEIEAFFSDSEKVFVMFSPCLEAHISMCAWGGGYIKVLVLVVKPALMQFNTLFHREISSETRS